MSEEKEKYAQQAKDVLKEGEKTIRKVVENLDDRVRENPWPYLGGVAVATLFIGFFMGMIGRNKS